MAETVTAELLAGNGLTIQVTPLLRLGVPDGTVLADSIAYIPHLDAWNKLFLTWFKEKDYSRFLIYIVDIVSADALPFLGWQFDVLGYKGWKLTTNDDERRALIKKAIELHRYKGTLWAVKESLKSIGFGDAVITEHVDDHWAKFRISVDLGERPLGETEIEDILQMVNTYKNTRSHLADISYSVRFADSVTPVDTGSAEPGEHNSDTVITGAQRLYDGTYNYDGGIDHSKDADILIVTVRTL